jgi:hypothetical protein
LPHRLTEVSGPFDLAGFKDLTLKKLIGQYPRFQHRHDLDRLDDPKILPYPVWLLHLGRFCQSEDVLGVAERYGFRPPRLRHVAAFGLRFPAVPQLAPVAGVPSPEDAKRLGVAAVLGSHGSISLVRLTEHHTGWSKECRFLLVG